MMDPYVRLMIGAKLANVNVLDNLTIDTYSCVNKSDIGLYFGLGFFSYVNSCQVGRYWTLGSSKTIDVF